MAKAAEFKYAYLNGKICELSKALIPINSKAVQYGIGVFTGMRGFWNDEDKQLSVFRLNDHYRRLVDAAKIAHMSFDLSYESFFNLCSDVLRKNKVREDCYVRVTLYAGTTELSPRLKNDGDDLAIYVLSLKNYLPTSGLKSCISSWRRFDDDVMSTKAKITGSYFNSALAKTDALLAGFDEPIFLNRDGKVSEASSANLFGVKDGVVYTPPLSANNLDGITRRSLITLLSDYMGIVVREEPVDRSMLYCFDELFFSGTAAKISWIKSVDDRMIGDGKLGKVTKSLQSIYDQVVHGKLPEYKKWLSSIYLDNKN